MINFKKYALAAALIIPTVFAGSANEAEAAKIAIDKNLAEGVNVRKEAKEGDNIIGLIDDENKTYEIISEEGNWLKIEFDGKEAYVGAHWFHILDETEVVFDTNFRKEDSLEAEVIEILAAGTKVEVLELADNGFVKVKVDEEEGYIYHNLLKSFRDAAEAKQPAQAKQAPAKQVTKTQQVQTTQTNYQAAPAQQTYTASSNWAKEWIAQRESGGSYTAYNPRGGYYGRYQLNPSLIPYGASPAQQEAAADAYVAQRYGSWERAQQFWAANGWY